MISCVNNDILHAIFIRMPVESLVRSRAVCKRWRAIIDEPPFARAHQHPHPINKSIVVIDTDPCYSLDLESLSFSSNGHQTIAATPLAFSGDILWSVVGACKGLVLTDRPLGILNPLTNERLDLYLDLPSGHKTAAYGLGYDYVTDDYKAVSISGLVAYPPILCRFSDVGRTDVYSLKTDSWRTINTNCPRDPEGPGVFVGGALNWIEKDCNDEDANNKKIIALDLGTEKYTLLQMPPRWWDRLFYIDDTTLDVLDGCLIMWANSLNAELDGWVMKDYGDEGSWILLFSIEHSKIHDGSLRPLGFIMKEEDDKMRLQVFLENGQCTFFLFDVKTKSSETVHLQGHVPDFFSQQMFPGTKFCLHDNCGRGGGGARRKVSSTSTSSANENSADLVKSFVFSFGP